MTKEEVRGYLLGLRGRGVARGTFKTSHYGLRFLYRETLGRDWALFGKKRYVSPSRKGSPMPLPTPKRVYFWPQFATQLIGVAFH